MKLLAFKKRMLQLSAKCNHRSPFKHVQSSIGSVSYVGSYPRYVLNRVCYLPSVYIPINGGFVFLRHTGEMVGVLEGYWVKERQTSNICDRTCNCEQEWETAVMNYVREHKCMCKHLYDYGRSGKSPETYFYPPTRHRQYYLDKVRIFQDSPVNDVINQAVEDALVSGDTTNTPSMPSVKAAGLTESELLESFLGDLAVTPLIIPHLPQASKLNSLLEWVRRRVKGRVNPELRKQLIARSMRRWLWLKHVDFKMLAYRIPFTPKQMRHMSWRYKPLLGKVFNVLLRNFVLRNSFSQLEQTRLLWPTMMFDMYPVPSSFRDIYFSYMPAKMTDTHIVNPFNSERTLKFGAKTCPLDIFLPPTQS